MSTSTKRYPRSIDAVQTDGRDINPEAGELSGEAGSQRASGSTDKHLGDMSATWTQLPEPRRNDPTYYDRPMLKEPVWGWSIPVYYYVGGLTGAALALGAAAQFGRSEDSAEIARRCHWIGLAGATVSGGLLIYDLGRPARFLGMLRVFRPTSPMNIGAWILSGTGAMATGALLFQGRKGLLGRLGDCFAFSAGMFGLGLATYTGVLVANTAVPIWQESRRVLPLLFASSALASLGCAFDCFPQTVEDSLATNIIGTVGRAAELAAGIAMEHHASVVPRVGRPFKRGLSAIIWRSSEILTLASLGVSILPNRTRRRRLVAGLLGTAGSLLLRFAMQHVGTVSARDARSSFHRQRAALSNQRALAN